LEFDLLRLHAIGDSTAAMSIQSALSEMTGKRAASSYPQLGLDDALANWAVIESEFLVAMFR
jgi:hypothetical protein